LTSDVTVRGHMEEAIGTILEFSSMERHQIKQRKAASEAWFYST
jgi:hypothetical protein